MNNKYKIAIDALRKISNPIEYMEQKAKEEHCKINGEMAIKISDDPNWIRNIATEALNLIQKMK